ncbi:histidine kinase [Flavihumibacter sp. R14]|nr:histidine kinase [Flavihumibacter soli]
MFRYKPYTLYSHLIGWLIFMSLPVIFIARDFQAALNIVQSPSYWFFCGLFMLIFYLNLAYLIPALYLRGKYFAFILSSLLLLSVVYLARPFDHLMREHRNTGQEQGPPLRERPFRAEGRVPLRPPGPPNGGMRIDIVSIFLFILAMAMAMTLKTMQLWRQTEKRALQAEAERANAELSFLKAQINPHFLFNTLNNIYTLALIRSDHTAGSIMKLSHIMRYLTEDSEKNFVPLREEVSCISDYIDLQKLRLGEASPVNFTVSGDLEGKVISPLILMTFIENSFKYGISKKEMSPISITLNTEDSVINFTCENRILRKEPEGESTGTGIENTTKRLAYIYPAKHRLNISTANDIYRVELTINV